ncbi:MAG: hypothetical protein PHW79_06135 [Candidatus Marinimicrobia bacterium]|nr:hypothetical protein [Candidatus Neomarinimicrobiota bacterium]
MNKSTKKIKKGDNGGAKYPVQKNFKMTQEQAEKLEKLRIQWRYDDIAPVFRRLLDDAPDSES